MAKALRDVYGDSLKKYGAENERVVVLDADVSSSTKSKVFGDAFPDRFFNVGIAESNMVGMAAGLATTGKIPFCNTFAVFLTSIGLIAARTFGSYAQLNIKLAGGYGGISDSYDGPTHHALEDLAIMRSLANFEVLVASDEFTTDWMVKHAIDVRSPMYLRLSRNEAKTVHTADTVFEPGKGVVVREGKDCTIIACGVMVGESVAAADLLKEEGISVKVIDMFSIKPIDSELILASAKETGCIVSAEEHNIIGGLGSAVAEVLTANNCVVPQVFVGIRDRHAECGDSAGLFRKYELDAPAIAEAVKKAIAEK